MVFPSAPATASGLTGNKLSYRTANGGQGHRSRGFFGPSSRPANRCKIPPGNRLPPWAGSRRKNADRRDFAAAPSRGTETQKNRVANPRLRSFDCSGSQPFHKQPRKSPRDDVRAPLCFAHCAIKKGRLSPAGRRIGQQFSCACFAKSRAPMFRKPKQKHRSIQAVLMCLHKEIGRGRPEALAPRHAGCAAHLPVHFTGKRLANSAYLAQATPGTSCRSRTSSRRSGCRT